MLLFIILLQFWMLPVCMCGVGIVGIVGIGIGVGVGIGIGIGVGVGGISGLSVHFLTLKLQTKPNQTYKIYIYVY